MLNINRILNKTNWTGKDLGKIALTDAALEFTEWQKGKVHKPLIEDYRLRKMVDTLDPFEGRIYNGYKAAQDWMSVLFQMAQGQLQQLQLQYRTLEGYIREAIIAEDIYCYVSRLPALMTKQQKEKAIAAGKERFFGNGKEEDYFTVIDLFDETLEYYKQKEFSERPKNFNPLAAVRKKYLKAPVKSKIILNNWNELTGKGYFTLADGTRSDTVTKQEFEAAVERAAFTQAGEDITKYLKGEDVLDKHANRHGVLDLDGAEWHYNTEPPKGLTKWQVIEELPLAEIYPAAIDGKDKNSKKNITASMKDLNAEFPELIQTLIATLDRDYKLKVADVPASKWTDNFISERQLYDLNFYRTRHIADNFYKLLDESCRRLNGIAIVETYSHNIDADGNYIEPKIESSLKDFSLEGFFTESPHYAGNVKLVESSRKFLLDSYYFLQGYNFAIERIAAIHEVPEVLAYKMSTKAAVERIDAFNSLVPVLYDRITNTPYPTGKRELKEKKKQVLKDFFTQVPYEKVTIPEANKQEAEELITNFSGFNPNHRGLLLSLLMIRPAAEMEEGK